MKAYNIITAVCFSLIFLSACKEEEASAQGSDSASTTTGDEVSTQSCSSCGTVIAISPVIIDGEGSGAGVVVGALVGGLLGNQVGGGNGKDVATVVGVVGGAVAGNAIEKNAKKQSYYDVSVEMANGERRTVSIASAEFIIVGSAVKVLNNDLVLL